MSQSNNTSNNIRKHTPLTFEQLEALKKSQKKELVDAFERKKSLSIDTETLNRPFTK